jgi:hypothetical protein
MQAVIEIVAAVLKNIKNIKKFKISINSVHWIQLTSTGRRGTAFRYLEDYRLGLSKINLASRGLLLGIISRHPLTRRQLRS